LEDINLKGARGVLVNITANDEVGLSEFSEVGNIIEEYASEDATVVIGCAIDPNVGEEMRVTVVATGLEGKGSSQMQTAVGAGVVGGSVTSSQMSAAATTKTEEAPQERAQVNVVAREEQVSPTASSVSAKPAPDAIKSTDSASTGAQSSEDKLSYLDIPAFLRRQAD
jgi:cell division protein FtsZ